MKKTALLVATGVLVLGAYLTNHFNTKTSAPSETITVSTASTSSNELTSAEDILIKKLNIEKVSPEAGQVVVLDAEIFRESVAAAVQALENVRAAGYKEAWLLIDSPGGSIIDGNALIAYIRGSGLKVNTVCTAVCASMGFHIHQAGYRRYMHEGSILMSHHAAGGLGGDFEHMRSFFTFLLNYVDKMDAEVAARAHMSMHDYKNLIQYDYWGEATNALDKHFTDTIAYVKIDNNKEKPYVLSNILKEQNVKAKPKSNNGSIVFVFDSYSGASVQ